MGAVNDRSGAQLFPVLSKRAKHTDCEKENRAARDNICRNLILKFKSGGLYKLTQGLCIKTTVDQTQLTDSACFTIGKQTI